MKRQGVWMWSAHSPTSRVPPRRDGTCRSSPNWSQSKSAARPIERRRRPSRTRSACSWLSFTGDASKRLTSKACHRYRGCCLEVRVEVRVFITAGRPGTGAGVLEGSGVGQGSGGVATEAVGAVGGGDPVVSGMAGGVRGAGRRRARSRAATSAVWRSGCGGRWNRPGHGAVWRHAPGRPTEDGWRASGRGPARWSERWTRGWRGIG